MPLFDVTNITVTIGIVTIAALWPRRSWAICLLAVFVYIFLVWYTNTVPCRAMIDTTPRFWSTVTAVVTRNTASQKWHPTVQKTVYIVDLVSVCVFFGLVLFFVVRRR